MGGREGERAGAVRTEYALPKSSLAVVGGATERTKCLHVAGKPAALIAKLDAWRCGLEGEEES